MTEFLNYNPPPEPAVGTVDIRMSVELVRELRALLKAIREGKGSKTVTDVLRDLDYGPRSDALWGLDDVKARRMFSVSSHDTELETFLSRTLRRVREMTP